MQAEEIISLNPKPMEIADVIVLKDVQQNLKYIWLVPLDAVGDATRNDLTDNSLISNIDIHNDNCIFPVKHYQNISCNVDIWIV